MALRAWFYGGIFSIAVTILSFTTGFAAGNQNTILSGKIISPVSRQTPMPFNAIIDKVLVTPGEAVEKGQQLIIYHLQDEAERILQKEVTLGAGTEDSRSQMLDLERRLAETIAQRNKTRQLVASKLGSAQALERLEGDVTSFKQRIDLLKSTITKAERNFKDRLKELESYFGTPIHEGVTLPRSLTLTAPIKGHVLSILPNLFPGSELAAETSPITVGQLHPMIVQVQVYEAEIGRIHEGDTAKVNIPSLQDKAFTAQVTSIAWTSNDLNVANPSFYNVELTLPNPDLELKPGFKAVVHFGKGP